LIFPLYDLHELARYLNLSRAGFENLSKCTDRCESTIQSLLVSLEQHSQPLHHLMIRIAYIKQTRLPKTRRNLFSSPPRAMGKPSYHHPLPSLPDDDQCSILYFWVHPDHVFELKLMLLFYCAFNAHRTISSTFFDNNQWEVYHSLLKEQRSSGSVALCR
jgi:SPX domain protein involved in polyphosphate accumulation